MKLKPILIENFVKKDNETYPSLIAMEGNELFRCHDCRYSYKKATFYDIILIDTEAKIVEGNLVYYPNNFKNKILTAQEVGLKREWFKIISSTNKSNKLYESETLVRAPGFSLKTEDISLPQLSEQSIKLLINYYNEFKCMPESVDVETWWELEPGNKPSDRKYDVKHIKFNQQGKIDITIPEDKKLYTEEEVEDLTYRAMKEVSYTPVGKHREWFKRNKKK